MDNFSDHFSEALSIASNVHFGQVDKGGQPYILHSIRVAIRVETEVQKICALLHDVLEDGKYVGDIKYVISSNFGAEILNIISILTKNNDESYGDYIERVSQNRDASIIKIADLEDNMDLSRIEKARELTEQDYKRSIKYQKSHDFLVNTWGFK